jgi:hypothetical protein
MDELAHYRKVIREIILAHAQYPPSHGDIAVETVFDETNDHYELVYAGWSGLYRIHGSAIHIDIRNGKIYIQHDGTEEGVATQLLQAGIPHDRIVLAFKHPDVRPDTEFAVA